MTKKSKIYVLPRTTSTNATNNANIPTSSSTPEEPTITTTANITNSANSDNPLPTTTNTIPRTRANVSPFPTVFTLIPNVFNYSTTSFATVASNITNTTISSITDSAVTSTTADEDVTLFHTKEEIEELKYGFGQFKPQWLQVLNQPRAVLALLSYSAFVQGFTVNGVINTNMSTIEKRFGFASHMSGWIASVYDMTAAPIILFVCFRGAMHYKLRWLGYGFICFTLGSFVMFLPHALAPTYKWDIEELNIHCSSKGLNSTTCDNGKNDPGLFGYLGVFLMGQILHSVGGSILYSLGVTLLDDIVKPEKTPLYIGIMMFFSTIGPGLGYIVGGQFLNIFVTPSEGNDIPFGSSDPRWIGAWWMGFLVSGLLSMIIGPILLGYAQEIPVTKYIRNKRKSMQCCGITKNYQLRSVFQVVKRLCKNSVFVLLSLSTASEGFIMAGLSTYFPKWIENQFQKTPGASAVITGLLVIPAAAGGQFISGYICRKLRLAVNGQLVLAILTLITSVIFSAVFWMHCKSVHFAGINADYSSSSMSSGEEYDFHNSWSSSMLISDCNENCHCAMHEYIPICGVNKIQYFSPCFAGCTSYVPHLKKHVNCSCITANDHSADDKECATHACPQFYWALPLLFAFIFFGFAFQTPLSSTILRVVPGKYRTFGFGVSAAIGRMLGTFPGPIIFGACLDEACEVWKPSCGSSPCWIYEFHHLALNFFLVIVCVRILTILFVTIADCLYIAPGGDNKRWTYKY